MVFQPVPLGELISTFYANFLNLYGNEELASLATASAVNELLEKNRSVAEQAELGCQEPNQ